MKRVLMIEDDTALQELYKYALSKESIQFTGSLTGKEGLDKAKKEKPDLIILDIMLPGGLNGFDVLEFLKKDPTTKTIPVLVLTNLDKEEKSAREIGAVEYLVKANTSITDVVSKIKNLLHV